MPTYSFACPDGHSKDVVLRMIDRDLSQHCHCGKAMRREMATGLPFTLWAGRWRDQWRDSPRERGGISDGLGPQAE